MSRHHSVAERRTHKNQVNDANALCADADFQKQGKTENEGRKVVLIGKESLQQTFGVQRPAITKHL
jgi:hypothetical protein